MDRLGIFRTSRNYGIYEYLKKNLKFFFILNSNFYNKYFFIYFCLFIGDFFISSSLFFIILIISFLYFLHFILKIFPAKSSYQVETIDLLILQNIHDFFDLWILFFCISFYRDLQFFVVNFYV